MILKYKFMNKLYSSVSKLVLLIITIALVGLTVAGIVEPKDFIMLAAMVFTYYFTKSTPNTPSI